MFSIFIFLEYLRRTSNYTKRITPSDWTHMRHMNDLVAIGIETPRIDSPFSLKKEFTKLIRMNPYMLEIIRFIHVVVVDVVVRLETPKTSYGRLIVF